jgi:hypothetical protein
MAVPLLGIAGVGANLAGTFLGAQEARRREKAMRIAMQRLIEAQTRDRATALWEQKEARSRFLADPRRAKLQSSMDELLANPDVIDPATLSLMKGQMMDSAAASSEGSIQRLRQQQQRTGTRGTTHGTGQEAALRARYHGRNATLATQLDLQAATANKESRRRIGAQYGDYLSGDMAREFSFSDQISGLYGNTRYDSGALLGFM